MLFSGTGSVMSQGSAVVLTRAGQAQLNSELPQTSPHKTNNLNVIFTSEITNILGGNGIEIPG